LRWAIDLQQEQDRLFFDENEGGYFMNVPRQDLLVRIKDDGDNVIPSGNSVAVLNGLRLAKLLGEKEFYKRAKQTLGLFASRLAERPTMLAKMAVALNYESHPAMQIVIIGDGAEQAKMVEASRAFNIPNKVVLRVEPGRSQSDLAELLPYIKDMTMLNGRPTAYVCFNYTCRAPTNDPSELERLLEAEAKKK
jgi:uncharacterized protein YyaL (SSP411 family)